MKGLDYRGIETLDAIIRLRSFEKAAEELCVSQSAISQRIKQLEKWLSQPVLVREQPPRATVAGEKLLGLYRRVKLLEQDLLPSISSKTSETTLSVSVATNADTLATWLLPSLKNILLTNRIELKLVVEDEGRTLEKLRSGEVTAAISTNSNPVPSCDAILLGNMEYLCVASKHFYQRHFSNGVTRETLAHAPAVVFDQHDYMHERFLQQNFQLSTSHIVKHVVRSSEAFVKLALSDVAYCLIPKIQIERELAEGDLVNITPDLSLNQKLYWHHWQLESGILQELSKAVISYARDNLF
ncbi:LysR family transcriptional regulator ArgP [Vibrio marisflavi]|uniref:HTH-type transcriptional regulator ArgP n=1 Tax=Vibrio marisflavi CECT 7928 TaxID=634439 RepID=A0ABM9A4H3_9VIBR|nr:LysR family transcriptional regulator ArgP [Vibrio marisflavi]CAH0539543.1 HTH-type transcriptional regulator ArgP [Vibrio marisflavi CECT 7928]